MKLNKKQQEFIKGLVEDIDNKNVIIEFSNSRYFKDMFPKLFKDEFKFKEGKWYIPEMEANTIWFIESIKENKRGVGYGVCQGVWEESGRIATDDSYFKWREATHKEVEEMLIKEAKKRGLVEGVSYIDEDGDVGTVNNSGLCLGSSGVYLKVGSGEFNDIVFRNGKWAEPIDTLTKEEAEKKFKIKIKC